jgi:hypothetical protein
MFSDERLKDDKQQIGTLPNGLGVYNFTYKGDPTDTPQTGLDGAGSREQSAPMLSRTDPATGYKKVDYGALGPEAQSIAPQMQPVPQGMMSQPKIKRTFDAPGGTKDKLGEFGDFLLAVSGNQAGLLGMRDRNLAAREDAAGQREEAQWTRRQDSELNRQIAVKQWEREHPAPINNDTVNDYNFRVHTLGQAGGRRMAAQPRRPNRYGQSPRRSGL